MKKLASGHLLQIFVAAGLYLFATVGSADPVPVELRQVDGGWQLIRDGEPYLIRGAGGRDSLDRLAAAGANSVRTWRADDAGPVLDEAHALGMTVTVGLWLEHERHGFDYSDEALVKEQKEQIREDVLRLKDHPALLLWGVGNEMEEYASGDDPRIWAAVNDIAAMIKEIDPHHPTMTVTAEIGGGRVEMVHRQTPAIDIHGINAYGGAPSIARRMREAGATKPYVITEFGPAGPWEVPETDWGAPVEQTSTQKAEFYQQTYQQSILDNPGMALGGYAFLWGHKMEGTATWFGMLLNDGSRLGVTDVMSELWSGNAPADQAPIIEPITIDIAPELDPGAEITAATVITDPEGGSIDLRWVLRPESGEYSTGGDFRPALPDVEDAILQADDSTAKIRMPDSPGAYRLFAYAKDPAGNAATANIPLLVKGEAGVRFPVSVYEDHFKGMPWTPTGLLGNAESLSIDGGWSENVFEGANAIRLHYTEQGGMASIVWQNSPGNGGDEGGGIDLTGASALEFRVRGEAGGEEVSFSVGLLDDEKKSGKIKLGTEWKKLRIEFEEGDDLSSLKVPLVVTLEGQQNPITLYLDSIRIVQ
jgi:hypothetical protein